jgi:ribosomal protein S18 acetylase RimI-like enzyme
MHIRKAKREDWRAILNIQQSDSVFPYIGHPRRPTKRRVRERWLERLAEPRVLTLVAVSDGEVVGYIRLKRGEGLGSHVGEISTVAVRPDFQMRGIGGQLMEEVLEVADGFGLRRLRLTVHEDNDIAIRLYRRMGFEIEGREREAVRREGRFIDLLIMGRSCEEARSPHIESKATGGRKTS